jgi:steroid 5-alpha reductase family enzyme
MMNKELRYASTGKSKSITICTAVYVVAAAVAFIVGYALRDNHPLLIAGIADLAATLVVFAFSVIFDNSSLYDPYWSVAPVPIAFFWALQAAPAEANAIRQVIVLILLCVWAIRLTFNWLRRWRGLGHEDWRYVDFRHKSGKLYWPVSLTAIHFVPTVLVFAGCLSLHAALAGGAASFNFLDYIALVVTAAAVLIETVTDRQLHEFLVTREDSREVLSSGLWAYSRHPNYFGEVLFWWGLFLFALASGLEYWWTIVGPIVITALFTFISVPMIEKHMKAGRPDYAKKRQGVSAFIPWFPKKQERN